VVRTDFTFLGVPLSPGATSVTLDFADPAYLRGKRVSLAAVAIALLLLAAGVFLERQRRAV
jgi:hypothetical protein